MSERPDTYSTLAQRSHQPKVAEAREFGRRYNKQMVIILAINTQGRSLEVVTYGENARLCDAARQLGDLAYDAVQAGVVDHP